MRDKLLRRMLVLYGALLLVALAWGALAGDVNVFLHRDRPGATVRWHDPLLGLAVGLAIVLASRLAERYFVSFRRLGDAIAAIVGRLSVRRILVVAAVSAVAEEALFRGAMQPTLGLPLTAVIFGLLHVAPSLPFWAWTAGATVGGFVLGWELEVTGNLVAPIVTHAVVNALNLHHIVNSRHGVQPPRVGGAVSTAGLEDEAGGGR